ncbi:MAG: MATE family efflux transporter, partial [Christensenellales bacterium]
LLSLLSGVALAVVGVAAAPVLLSWMGTPADVLDQAVLYMRIYFAGMPVIMLYNFGSAILRAVGDTKRPLYFLFIAGLVNVGLNLFFVIVWHMGVAGVALATVLSQIISAALVLACLVRSEAGYRVNLRKLHIYKDKFLQIVKIGVPAGIQGAMFSISNVLIQSSINSFGSIAMAGNTAASNIEGFVYTSMNAIYQTGLSFTSQNMGAKNYPRINRILLECVGIVTVAGLVMGWVALLFGHSLLGIYSSDQEVITYGINRMWVICSTYFVCGIMDLVSGFLRGMGYSMMPTLVSLTGVCGLRVLWIFTVFAWNRSLFTLYLSYPISWVITGVAHLICYVWGMRKLKAKQAAEAPLAQSAST